MYSFPEISSFGLENMSKKSLAKLKDKLDRAIRLHDFNLVTEIIEIIEKNNNLDPFLITAIEYSYFDIAKLLLEHGANPSYIHEAIYKNYSNNLEKVKFLLVNGADVNHRDVYGNTPLLISSFSGQEEITLYLIEAGADISASDQLGFMPVHGAVINNLQLVLKVLKQRDINIDISALKPNLSVLPEDLDKAAIFLEDISKDDEIILTFFALKPEKQLKLLPALKESLEPLNIAPCRNQEYLFNFSSGDVLTTQSLCVLSCEYDDFLNGIYYHFFDIYYPTVETAVSLIRSMINYDGSDNSYLPETLLTPKLLVVRWLSQYLKDCFYIDRVISKDDIKRLIIDCLHP
ncbi:MAG: ankyrin repeat domain-containing protein [Waterburya sp.]